MQGLWTIQDWLNAYQQQAFKLDDLLQYVAEIKNDDHAWISIATAEQIQSQIQALEGVDPNALALYGVPFAVKDNIDVAGFTTTAACTVAEYVATDDATVVAKLKAAGAIVVGKTNLDQFATGLVGIRSDFGAVKNSFNPAYISGGSSSGSAVSVANGQVPFALGTDTAGSGRVPAAHNNIVGLKPTKGWFSTTGLIPACRTLDVISIFALTVDDAWQVAQVMQGFDATDDYSRQHPANVPTQFSKAKIAIPNVLEFYGDSESELAFHSAIERVKRLGYSVESIDFSDFNELAAALYSQSWVAERTLAVENRVQREQAHPIIASIIAQADRFSAVDAMRAEYTRARLARRIQQQLAAFDALMVPTAPTIYRIEEVAADPLLKNSHMGAYTNFVNLADLSALALPNGIRQDGLPTGVTFIAPAWMDEALAKLGQHWQSSTQLALGTSSQLYKQHRQISSEHAVKLAVVGAHLTDMPLNFQLLTRHATLLEKTRTSAHYKLFALQNSTPPKPGLQYQETGTSIEVEVWEVPRALFGNIVAEVPAPLGIGNVQLVDGSWVKGFICEGYALADATDISHFGGWRDYIQSKKLSNTKFHCLCIGEVSK